MNPITLTELNRLRGQIEACAKLLDGSTRVEGKTIEWHCDCRCKSRIAHAYRVADQANSILKSATGGTRSSDTPDPVFSLAYPALSAMGTEPKPVEIDASPTWLEQLTVAARTASKAVSDLTAIVHVVGTITSSEPAKPGTAGAGNCVACGRQCIGLGEDRLRHGYCPACRMAWERAGRPDRAMFARERLARLAPSDDDYQDGSDIEERLNPGHQRAC